MNCTECDKECNNEDMLKCASCVAPMLCTCKRPEVRAMVDKLWLRDSLGKE